VTGRVVDVLVEEGMKVEEGQILAHLDSSNVAVNLRLAEAQLEAARVALGETEANLVLAEKNFERSSALSQANVVSISDLDRAVAELAAMRARLARQRSEILVAEQQVATWQQQIDDTIIRAPFAGVVTSKNAQPGEMISPISAGGGFTRTGICTLVDMSSLEVEVDVNESYINRVRPGQPVVVTLDAYPDWRIGAKVIAIIPTADRQKATVRVRVGFEALDARILPDMGLKVAFQDTEPADAAGGARSAVIVPAGAVRRAADRDVVWIVRDGRVERRAVSIASRQGEEVTIAAGLSGGETVVIQGPDTLADGVRVTES
jgi:RND family efflux transporter MFP subunit